MISLTVLAIAAASAAGGSAASPDRGRIADTAVVTSTTGSQAGSVDDVASTTAGTAQIRTGTAPVAAATTASLDLPAATTASVDLPAAPAGPAPGRVSLCDQSVGSGAGPRAPPARRG